jgi:type II secretory pathway pseudopilin PulG
MLKRTALVALGLIALVLVAAKLLLPSYVTSPRQAQERVLQQDLYAMRAVIRQYTLDKQQRPHSLDDSNSGRIPEGRANRPSNQA